MQTSSFISTHWRKKSYGIKDHDDQREAAKELKAKDAPVTEENQQEELEKKQGYNEKLIQEPMDVCIIDNFNP